MAWGAPGPFRLHLSGEPSSLSPFTQRTSASGYLLAQLSCPLLKWQSGEAIPWAAKCRLEKKGQRIRCEIDPELKFQNGEPVRAEHYLKSFRAFLNPTKPSPRADLLFAIRGAREVVAGKKPSSELGVSAKDRVLTFELEENSADFLLTLTNPLLTAVWSEDIPTRENFSKFVSCGPYQFSAWSSGKKIVLTPNPHFPKGHPKRPDLEYLFIAEDSLAYQAYQKNGLEFLRRLPTLYLPQWEKSIELHKVDQIRFDYLALSPEFRDPAIARALAQSIDFETWRKLYHAKPRPGCFGIPESWTKGPVCWDFNPSRAKIEFEKIKGDPRLKRLRLFYSKQGGDDHDRTMEFLQTEWKKNLGLEVKIEAQENKIFLETLRNTKAPFFRKGLSPERPSCLAILENFMTDAPENYPQVRRDDFDKLVRKLSRASGSEAGPLCRQGIELLRDEVFLIPTGPIYFSLLAKPDWQGWTLNELNQLDLSGLHRILNEK